MLVCVCQRHGGATLITAVTSSPKYRSVVLRPSWPSADNLNPTLAIIKVLNTQQDCPQNN